MESNKGFFRGSYEINCCVSVCFRWMIFGQIIDTSAEVTRNGGDCTGIHQSILNSGLGIVVVCLDDMNQKHRSKKNDVGTYAHLQRYNIYTYIFTTYRSIQNMMVSQTSLFTPVWQRCCILTSISLTHQILTDLGWDTQSLNHWYGLSNEIKRSLVA